MPSIYFDDPIEELAYKAWKGLNLAPPVDLQKVADKLGIIIKYEEFSEEIDGFYLKEPNIPPIIAINSIYTKPLTRKRFTLALEIGHHLFANSNNKKVMFIDTSKRYSSILERKCDRFAVYLLMPTEHIKKNYNELAHNAENRLSILSSRFEVSSWAMRRRLKELGLEEKYRRLK
ncbi:MAG: ImmA/IrrE family metallo-endopeptidase [Armatimonadota bacterium]